MKFLAILTLCFLCTSCILDGTDTGNPGLTNENCGNSDCNQMSDGRYPSKLYDVVSQICILINDCKSQSTSSCRQSIKNQRNFDTELGLDETDERSVEELILSERYGFLVADSNAADTCETDISNLDCMDSEVEEAYDSNLANPYEKTATILPASCQNIFINNATESP